MIHTGAVNKEPHMPIHGNNDILESKGENNEDGNIKAGYCLPRFSGGKWVWCCQGKPICAKTKYQCDILCFIKS